MRRRARQDANAPQIVQALRSVGWCVWDTSRIGGGFPDVVAARRGILTMIEIKDGSKSPSRRGLTDDERIFHEVFLQAGIAVQIVSSIEEALSL